MKQFFLVVFFLPLTFVLAEAQETLDTLKTINMHSIRYADFNNNQYTLSGAKLTYNPIQPINSSSGTYSGGEPMESQLTEDQLTEIYQAASILADKESLHLEKRRMLTAVLSFKPATAETSIRYILARSEEVQAFETLLKEALQPD